MRTRWLVVMVVSAAAGGALAQPDVTFSDGEFLDGDWSALEVLDTTAGGGATFEARHEDSGGNPGAYRYVRHEYCAGQVVVGHLRAGAVYDPSEAPIGAISAVFDLIHLNPPEGQAVAYGVLLKQGENYYTTINSRLVFDDVWLGFTQPDLQATDFQKVAGPGGLFPDFGFTGAEIEIGYYSGNGSVDDCRVRESGIDNWSVTVDTVCLADFNGDGQQNLFDFLGFQTAFGDGDPSADVAPPFGTLNLFDFLRFQTLFGDGC